MHSNTVFVNVRDLAVPNGHLAKKVLFVVPRARSLFGDEPDLQEGREGWGGHPHVGVAYLVSFLKQYGVDSRVFDETVENSSEKLVDFVTKFAPDLIGVTAYSYSYRYLVDTIRRLKACTNRPLVVGGPHVSATREDILKNTAADLAVYGEGEITLLELLQVIDQDSPNLSTVDGLIWRRGGEIVENRPRGFIRDVDALPFPDYQAFRLDRYKYTAERKLPLITSRGCPFGCNFCSVRLSMGRSFRSRSVDNVVGEIAHWYGKGWRSFEFDDDVFTLDMQRAEMICDAIIEKGLKISFELYNGVRVDQVSRELLGKMKEAGCVLVSFGAESANDVVLANIRKKIKPSQVRQAVEWANEVRLRNSVNFIIGHPGENYVRATETLEFAKSLPADFVNFYNLVPYPGTELFEWVKQHGRFLVPVDTYLQHISYRDNEPIFETDDFTRQERREVAAKGFDLYEQRILEFRLGKVLGAVVYVATRFRPLARLGRTLALNNRIGTQVYNYLSRKSRAGVRPSAVQEAKFSSRAEL